MPRGLMISHLKNTRYIHGGFVYRETIKRILAQNDPGLVMDEIFVHSQHHCHWRLCRQVYDVLTAPLSSYPAKVKHFRTASFRRRLQAALAENNYSLFVISGADMLWTLECLPAGTPILYIAHNIEHLLYGQQVAKYQAVPGIGALLRADADKFKAFELHHLGQLSAIVAIANEDREALRPFCPQARLATVPPSFDYPPHVRRHDREPGEPLRLGFLGNLEWWPNRRSLEWFLTEVFPGLNLGQELHLYGQGSAAWRGGARVHGHGFVVDLTRVWDEVDLMIQPITCGAGVNIKVAESLYNRMPMIATPLALRGIDIQPDPAVRVLAGAKEWIDALNDPLAADQGTKRVRPENAEQFSLARNAAALQALLSPNAPSAHRPHPAPCHR